ncbi:ABC transporter substrate-binding protein [Celerinatantimonas diazotrophica]|uniref:Iron complex transport system substrate-binding protein n=1 Tax=Celerinatantimonas diazotrophica TaxID=412034 RepID=A0A4R1J7Y7_9GAMM|nr:Fe(3+) dicitrate ABC transporter substrate-binding protein [Celerinatantimonas diazotrophica]TCK46546.1 iron complex transport system substrate-binding protein [Celerinatantimonas diazotrophica]CAG9296596.1 Fe(3+) dicitrate-binding periplasmic protein [Celerinatantimonas diazotrophica]
MRHIRPIVWIAGLILLALSFVSWAHPLRVVALEFSFAEDLTAIGIHPVGIADDGRANQLINAVRKFPYQSVGSRAQPNIEAIASLKPDLIIADRDRHQLIKDQLNAIAPTLLLSSKRTNYSQSLKVAKRIAQAVGKKAIMEKRIAQQHHYFASLKFQLRRCQHQRILFVISRGRTLYAHAADSFVGSIFEQLGFISAATGFSNSQPSRQINIEQLLWINPDIIVLGKYGRFALSQIWKHDPLWNALKAVKDHHVYSVQASIWSRGRGILSAEQIAKQLTAKLAGECS